MLDARLLQVEIMAAIREPSRHERRVIHGLAERTATRSDAAAVRDEIARVLAR